MGDVININKGKASSRELRINEMLNDENQILTALLGKDMMFLLMFIWPYSRNESEVP